MFDFSWFSDPNAWAALATLTLLEIVLGIDNIVFISILVGRLPIHLRDKARRLGLAFAMVTRLLLLASLSWVMGLTSELVSVFGQGISGRDFVLLGGGLFLLYKATHEIFIEVEALEEDALLASDGEMLQAAGQKLFWVIIGQIAVIDIIFSIDSVITAVGMVDNLGVMMAAVVTAVGVMLFAAKPIGEFVDRHPSVKVLALAFLVMVGMALIGEAFEMHILKGYIYVAMAFSLAVEVINIRARRNKRQATSYGRMTSRGGLV